MEGGVYTKEKCPICGGRFKRTGAGLLCPTHQTKPGRYFVQIYDKSIHKRINLYTDSQGHPFLAYEQADRILVRIRSEKDSKTFDPTRYVSQKLKPLRFRNWSKSWLQKKEIEVQRRLKAPSYIKAVRVYCRRFEDFFGDTDIRDIGSKAINDFISPWMLLLNTQRISWMDWQRCSVMPLIGGISESCRSFQRSMFQKPISKQFLWILKMRSFETSRIRWTGHSFSSSHAL